MAESKQKDRKGLTLIVKGEKIDKVFRMAVRNALRRHKEAGNPVAIWRNGKVVIIQPNEIDA